MPPIPPLTPAGQDMVRAIREHEPTLLFQCEDHIRGLVRAICVDNEHDCKYIRGLHFAVGAISVDVAAMLFHCIDDYGKRMPLKDLRFEEAEALLGSDPRLVDAFAALTTVRTLHIADVGKHASKMLTHMESPLRSAQLSLSYDRKWALSPDEAYYADPIYLLSSSHATLRKLNASGATTGNHWQEYPKMRRLELDSVDVPRTYDYVKAFPKLLHLTVSSNLPYTSSDVLARCEATRQLNQKEQGGCGSRRFFCQVTGPLIDVYMLGLSCLVIRTMDIVVPPASGDQICRMLRTVIADGTPRFVRLTVTLSDIAEDGIIFAFDRENSLHLRELKLRVITDRDVRPHRVRDAVECLWQAIHELLVETLHLRFEVKPTTCTEADRADSDTSCCLEKISLKWLGWSLLGKVPSLENVRISVVGLNPDEEVYAELSSTRGDRAINWDYPESDSDDDLCTESSESDGEDLGAEDSSGVDPEDDEYQEVGGDGGCEGSEDTSGDEEADSLYDDAYATEDSVEL